MINLLPPDEQKQLRAARSNTLLLKYIIATIILLAVMLLELAGAAMLIKNSRDNNEKIIADNNMKAADYAPIKTEAERFTKNLSTAKHILGQQTPYTDIILSLANNLPQGTVLEKLVIDPKTFGTPTPLSIRTTSYDQAINAKNALQNTKLHDKPLFTSVSFQSVAQTDTKTSGQYPYIANYNVVYAKDGAKP